MPSGFETIGWVLSVKDQATQKITKVANFVTKTVNKTGNVFVGFTEKVADNIGERGLLGQTVLATTAFFSSSFASAFRATQSVMEDTFTSMGQTVKAVKRPFKALINLMTGTGSLKEAFMAPLKSLKDLGQVVVRSVLTPVKAARIAVQTLATGMGSVFRKILGVSDIVGTIKKMGGIGGALLGPLGPLLNLFKPIIDMIVKQFTPAIETFSAIVETAFGPFAMTLEMIAQTIAPKVAEFIKPLASWLEVAALHVGSIVANLLDGKVTGAGLGLMKAFKGIQPVIMDLMKTLMEIVKDILPELGNVAKELAPVLVELFGETLKALLPLLKPLAKLGIALLKHVFVPTVKWLAETLTDWLPALAILIKENVVPAIQFVTEAVSDFFSPGKFGKYINDFNILFIDPLMEFLGGVKEGLLAFPRFVKDKVIDPALEFIQPVIETIQTVQEGISDLLGLGDEEAPTPAVGAGAGAAAAMQEQDTTPAARAADLAGLTGQERREAFDKWLRERKGMAKGGIVKTQIDATIGEAGPEMVLPLKRETVERVLTPLLPDMEFPALDRLVEFAEAIHRRLTTGVVRVDTGLPMNNGGGERDRGNDLGMAVGMEGIGAW